MARVIATLLIGGVLGLVADSAAAAQKGLGTVQKDPNAPPTPVSEGAVISTTRATLVIRTEDGVYQLFAMDPNTTRPTTIPVRSKVSIAYTPSADGWAPTAELVRVLALPPAEPEAAAASAPAPTDDPVPQGVRRLEQQVQRQVRRYRVGVRGGTSLDPELVNFGAQAQLGPFFGESMWARPSFELGFGEVTTLLALNLEAAFRLPGVARGGRWTPFVAVGPAFNFSKLGFSEPGEERDRFDFSDLVFDTGFNVVLGVQHRNGVFFELKSTAYSLPHLRLQFGYTF